VKVVMPTAKVSVGLGEPRLLNEIVGNIVQLTRFGFVRVDEVSPGSMRLYFAHG